MMDFKLGEKDFGKGDCIRRILIKVWNYVFFLIIFCCWFIYKESRKINILNIVKLDVDKYSKKFVFIVKLEIRSC